MGTHPSPYEHIIRSQQFDQSFLEELFSLTDEIKAHPSAFSSALDGKVVASLFYEPSTRTRLSFESAVLRLGGTVVGTENAGEFSSASKGETLEDSIRVVSGYADVIILRHNEDNSSERAVLASNVPLINAGSGKSQHPTQALLDVYTIREYQKTLEGLSVAVAGDLLRGRTCDSLVYLLSKYSGNKFLFTAPAGCEVKKDLKEHLNEHSIAYSEHHTLEEVVAQSDVLYMTRIQKERFDTLEEYEAVKGRFILTPKLVDNMKESANILHPLPRVDEIPASVDADPRSVYFEQAKNGLWIRMALLLLLTKK